MTADEQNTSVESQNNDKMGGELEALRRNSARRRRHIKQRWAEIEQLLDEEQRDIDRLTKRNASPG